MINVKVLKENKQAKIIVVTPLLPNHKISRDTRISLKRNDVPFTWITAAGNFNIPTNVTMGLNYYEKNHSLPKYFLMIDRDITLGRNMIDRMYNHLTKQKLPIAYTYANFEYKGYINQKFPARPFDISLLIQHNYISSNSMFRMDILREVGLVTDDKYKRLLDWAFLLKLFKQGYIGTPCHKASFEVNSTQNDISAGSQEDYNIKRQRVLQDFVKPLTEDFQKAREKEQGVEDEVFRVI